MGAAPSSTTTVTNCPHCFESFEGQSFEGLHECSSCRQSDFTLFGPDLQCCKERKEASMMKPFRDCCQPERICMARSEGEDQRILEVHSLQSTGMHGSVGKHSTLLQQSSPQLQSTMRTSPSKLRMTPPKDEERHYLDLSDLQGSPELQHIHLKTPLPQEEGWKSSFMRNGGGAVAFPESPMRPNNRNDAEIRPRRSSKIAHFGENDTKNRELAKKQEKKLTDKLMYLIRTPSEKLKESERIDQNLLAKLAAGYSSAASAPNTPHQHTTNTSSTKSRRTSMSSASDLRFKNGSTKDTIKYRI